MTVGRRGVPRVVVQGRVASLLYTTLSWLPCPGLILTPGTVMAASGVTVQNGDALGSGPLYSLGSPPSAGISAQSRHRSSRSLHREDGTRWDGIGQRLDSRRAEWLLFTLELDSRGERRNPGYSLRAREGSPRITTFAHLCGFARTPRAGRLRITLCDTF